MELRNTQNNIKSFQWIGPPLRRSARDRRNENIKYYCKFKYGNFRGKIGDYVLISNVVSLDPDTIEGCDVARILELYQSDECEEGRAIVQWYTRPQNLPNKFSSHKYPFPQLDYNCEVVEDKRNFDNDVAVESFFERCEVLQAMPDEDPKEIIENYCGNSLPCPTFVVRFQFLARNGKQGIEPIRLEENIQLMGVECGDNDRKCAKDGKNIKSIVQRDQKSNAPGDDGSVSSDSDSLEVILNPGEPRLRYVLLSNEDKSEISAVDDNVKSKTLSVSKKKSQAKVTKKKNIPRLKDKDISSLLEDDEEENSLLSSDECDKSENEENVHKISSEPLMDTKPDNPNVNIIIARGSSLLEDDEEENSLLSSDECNESENEENVHKISSEPLMDTKPDNSNVNISRMRTQDIDSDEHSGAKDLTITPKSSVRVRKTPKKYDDDWETPKSHKKVVKEKFVQSPKRPIQETCVPPKKRLQLLSEVGKGHIGVNERGSSAGPLFTPSSQLEEARSLLHVSSIPNSLPCRDQEFRSIYSFVEDKILDGAGGCMYICGVPGTGKTATVREVVRQLQEASSKGEIPTFEFGEVNGMRITEPRRVYSEVLRVLTGRVCVSPKEAQELLDQRFSKAAPRRLPTLLLIDELDLLCTKRQDVVYNLMDWPSREQSRLVVITIANTMDLPERVLMGRVSSRLGLTRLTFHPYTFQQLQEIVMSRMKGLNAFDPDAVQLVSRKVASVSGDARRALDICRRAIEFAESELAIEKKNKHQSPRSRKFTKKSEKIIVSMRHVDQAVSEMISSSKAKAIKACSRLEKLFLQAIATEVERTGIDEASFERVHSIVCTLCTYSGFRRPTMSETMSICWRLGSLRLILTEDTSRADILQRVMLNVDVDSVHYALKSDAQ